MNHLKNQLESNSSRLASKIPHQQDSAVRKSLKKTTWYEFKKNVASSPNTSHDESLKFERLLKILKRTNFNKAIKFNIEEYNNAFERLQNSAPGSDNIKKSLFPLTTNNKQKILSFINENVFNSSNLPGLFKDSRSQMIPKPNDNKKMRPLSIVSKLSALTEIMIIQRLEPAVKTIFEDNRFGFLKGQGVEDFYARLL